MARRRTVDSTTARAVDRGSLEAAAANVEVGLPVPPRARRRSLKRLIARLGWFLVRRQIDFNAAALSELTTLHDGVAQLRVKLTEMQTRQDQLSVRTDLVQRQAFLRHEEGMSAVRAEAIELVRSLDDLREDVGQRVDGLRVEVGQRVDGLRAEVERESAHARVRQAQIDLFLDRVRRALPADPDPVDVAALPSAIDSLYVSFEATFRGAPELIMERATSYLDDVLSLDRRGPVLDIGCGGGEWLQLLKEHGAEAYGIDVNEHYVRSCKEAGLDVRQEDARFHLTGLAPASLAVVSAFHVFEHMEVPELVEVIDLAIRALEPGGLLLLETPNPDCLPVGASSFYTDPTHKKPLNPHFVAFLVEARGLADVEIRYQRAGAGITIPDESSPWAAEVRPIVEALNRWLFGPMDYAVLGRRV